MRFTKGLVRQFVVPIAGCLVLISGLVFSVGDLSEASANPSYEPVGSDLRETLSILGVEPASAPNDVDTEIQISGTGFTDPPQVFLGENALTDVSLVNETELIAVVPWGLATGDYELSVVNSNEVSVSWDNVFTITDGFGEFITNGPYGGNTIQLAVQPDNPSTVYALMFGAGLFISKDSGENWRIIHDHDWGIQLDFDAGDTNLLYLGADSNDLYLSEDNGDSWERISGDIYTENGCFRSYPAAHPTKAGTVYFGMGSCGDMSLEEDEGGVYYSDDYGESWEQRINGLTVRDVQSLAIHPDGDTLIAGTFDGSIFYSEDGGLNWTEADLQLKGSVMRLFINPEVEGIQAWAITSQRMLGSGGDSHLYRSNGGLNSWEEIDIEVNGDGQMAFFGDTTWLASRHLYKFENGVINTTPVEMINRTPQAIVIPPGQTQVMYLGSDYGIHKSADGGETWQEINQGLAALVPNALAVSSSDPDAIYVKTHQGIFKSQSGGNDWQHIEYGGGGFPGGKGVLMVDQFDSERIYLSVECQGQFCLDVSSNGGWDWETKTADIPEGYEDWQSGAYAITPSPHTVGLVVAGTSLFNTENGDFKGLFYISEDYGETWDYVLPDSDEIDRILEVEFDAFDPDLLYAATTSTGLWRSEDGGTSWEKLPFDVVEYPVGVSDIAVHPDVPDKVFIRTSNATMDNPEPELWVSEDRGETWESMAYVFLGVDMIVSPPMPGMVFYSLFTGCVDGLCRSYDMGQTWTSIEGIPRPEILETATDGERTILYMGTPGGLVNSAEGGATMSREDPIPGLGSITGGGVYRLTQRLGEISQIYLPLIGR